MSNKFVSFLKKAGQILAAGAEVAIEAIPILQPFIGLLPVSKQASVTNVLTQVQNDSQLMLNSVVAAEAAGAKLSAPGLTGPQKATIAATYITPIFTQAAAQLGLTKPADAAAVNQAMIVVAGGIADFMNAYEGNALPNPPAVVTAPAAPTTPTTAPSGN